MNDEPLYLYKILTADQWNDMRTHGISAEYGSAMDKHDGYLHMSTAYQVPRIAKKYFADMEKGYLLQINYDEIEASVKWEPNSQGELYAHGYSDIPTDAVVKIYDFSPEDFDYSLLAF